MDYYNNDYLMHYGVKGMKWGVRRYQNEDGTLTNAGKERYYNDQDRASLFSESKKNVNVSSIPNRSTITGIDDITEAGKYLRKQNEVVSKHFDDYSKSYNDDLIKMRKNKNFMSDIKKKFAEDFGGPDQVDDEDLVDLMVYDYVDMYQNKYLSSKTKNSYNAFHDGIKQYYDNVKSITEDIVGQYGDQPVAQFTTTSTSGSGLFTKVTTTKHDIRYDDAVKNTLHDIGQSSWLRYLHNHEEIAYIENENYDLLIDAVKKELMR